MASNRVMNFLMMLEASAFSTWLRTSDTVWAYPTVLTLHTTGMGVLVGANWMLDFRLLGAGAQVPLAPLKTLFRAMWIGFWVNAVTGCMLFAADATTKGVATVFQVKLAFIFLAVITAILIKRTVFGGNGDPGSVRGISRALAAFSIVLWMGAITAGRLMAYL